MRTQVRLEDRMTGGESRVGDGAVEYMVQKSLFEEASVGSNPSEMMISHVNFWSKSISGVEMATAIEFFWTDSGKHPWFSYLFPAQKPLGIP